MNFIPGHAVFTEPVEDFQSFQSKNLRETVTFYKERADGERKHFNSTL